MADSSGTTLIDLISADPSPVPASTSSSSLSKTVVFICSAVLSFSVSFPNLSQTLFDFIMMNDCTNWPGKEPPSSNIGLLTLLRCLKNEEYIVDQDTVLACQTSAVQTSQIMYRNISGKTKSKEAMKFACSETTLCSNINLEKKDDTAETYCNSAQGFGYGILSQDKGYILTDHNENTELAGRIEDRIIHTEL
ncbi:hypothetical protein V6N13_135014 [Hibiscus sabdariffa]|uniref:Uncharacterized protein n=1 Tax=Hibiscus sabdariffa TaxID=183260 RepID=A0ABR2R5I1_9ROSI